MTRQGGNNTRPSVYNCLMITCPVHARCIEFPSGPVCKCRTGRYLFNETCEPIGRSYTIEIKLDKKYKHAFGDSSSPEFVELAHMIEETMAAGVNRPYVTFKVVELREGSVIAIIAIIVKPSAPSNATAAGILNAVNEAAKAGRLNAIGVGANQSFEVEASCTNVMCPRRSSCISLVEGTKCQCGPGLYTNSTSNQCEKIKNAFRIKLLWNETFIDETSQKGNNSKSLAYRVFSNRVESSLLSRIQDSVTATEEVRVLELVNQGNKTWVIALVIIDSNLPMQSVRTSDIMSAIASMSMSTPYVTYFNKCQYDVTSDCDVNAACTQRNASYSCECKPGYYGNGYQCTDIFVGEYECREYDGTKEKNGGHYVMVTRNSVDGTYKWKNRAGEMWTLYPMQGNSLRVGSDSPYNNMENTTAEFQEDGVFGPWREFYIRKVPCSLICPDKYASYEPVCGSNGKTYANKCLFKSAQLCEKMQHLTIVNNGTCKETKFTRCGHAAIKRTNISCHYGERIKILHAMYGRTSEEVCVGGLQYGQSTNCSNPSSLKIAKETCDGKSECMLEATPSMFGDPCVGDSEYLEVRYHCYVPDHRVFTVQCEELKVTGVWEKNLFRTKKIKISLNDPSCNHFMENATHVWIATNFTDCSSRILERGYFIYQENTALVTAHHTIQNIQRTLSYQYTMSCVFDRRVNVSTVNGFNTTEVMAGLINGSDVSAFKTSIVIYGSSSFLKVADTPITVTSFQPIYIGIKKTNPTKEFKFVVHRCYATPSGNSDDLARYMFFDMRCPIDRTFKAVSYSGNHFNFRIDAFTFIAVRKAVFIHCNLYVCMANSTAPKCQQKCSSMRKRRAITDYSLPLGEVSLKTDKITYEKKRVCSEVTCAANSYCLELYPAVCRCNNGYVKHTKTGACHKDNLLIIRSLHLKMDFLSTYADPTSTDFLNLATRVEKELTASLQLDADKIEGVKVLSARKGSVVLDLAIIYAETTTKEEAFKSFLNSIMVYDAKVANKMLQIKTEILPTMEVYVISNDDNIPLVAIVVPIAIVAVIANIALVIFVKRFRVRVSSRKAKELDGIDNNEVSIEENS